MNPGAAAVQVVLEAVMLGLSLLNYHPLKNDQTTAIAPDDLLRFIRACGHEPQILSFAPSEILA
jgi:Ala-tRNA(Pro) deacylase